MHIISEQAISHGRIDIEVKFNNTPENALKQIKEMKHYEPFIKDGIRIILLGLSFNRSEKQFDIAYAHRVL